ncbi:MAG: hypothetical protein QGH70_02045 [Nitrospinota bacterium]|jgi:xanthine dehydrogenase iron-sulfur cluster and FAD-binding subunit A|nr:hypothetical protein [Nitrospinota bacterium]MDP6618558.1 hypothetical protein [Nitrospinota bacterium]
MNPPGISIMMCVIFRSRAYRAGEAALSEARTWARDELLSGNIRRCTGYHYIVDAREKAAGLLYPK